MYIIQRGALTSYLIDLDLSHGSRAPHVPTKMQKEAEEKARREREREAAEAKRREEEEEEAARIKAQVGFCVSMSC